MMVEINEETSRYEAQQVELSLPKWKWKVLEKRAIALHGGDMAKCLSEIFDSGFYHEIKILQGFHKDALCS